MAFDELMEKFGRSFIPKRFREPLQDYLLKAGYDRTPYSLFGVLFFVAVGITYAAFLYAYPFVMRFEPIARFIATMGFWTVGIGLLVILFMFFIWSYLNLRIYARTKEMELNLPDYLTLVVTNLRSGMSFDKSLWSAIRPEFGVLSKEIAIVSKKVMTGNDTSEALDEFARRYDSPILRRSINLIISEVESGGEIADVIERVVANLRKTEYLKKEMAAQVTSYMLFISIIVMALAPLLFSLANTLLHVIIELAGQLSGTAASGGSSAAAGPAGQISGTFSGLAERSEQLKSDFYVFSYMALATISFFAGLIVSIIEKGDVRGGLRYIPVFLTVTLVLFYFSHKMVMAVFGSIV
jgi:pilus assembly protein TadC